jgi:hypothetical protein
LEVPAVTATALLLGQGALAARRPVEARALTSRTRALALAPLALLVVAAGLAHAGNRAAAAVDDAIARDDPGAAVDAAARARRWAPWSTDALRLSAEAELAAGNDAAARSYLDDALRRDATDWELWYARSFAAEGREADAAWERARRLNPRAPELAVPRTRGTAQDLS